MPQENTLIRLHRVLENEPHQIGNLTTQILNEELKLRDAVNSLKIKIKTHEKFFLIQDARERIIQLKAVFLAIQNLMTICNEILALREAQNNVYGIVIVKTLDILAGSTALQTKIKEPDCTVEKALACFEEQIWTNFLSAVLAFRDVIKSE